MTQRIELLGSETQKCNELIDEATRDKSALQDAVDKQGITIQQIDQMNGERDLVRTDSDAVKARLEETYQKIKDKETEANSKLSHLESLAREYSSLCYKVGIRDEEFELLVKVNDGHFSSSQIGSSRGVGDRLLADSETGYHPARILNLDMRGKVKSHIASLRRETDKRRNAVRDKDEENRRMLFDLASAIDDMNHEIETLKHRERAAEEEYEKTKEVGLSWPRMRESADMSQATNTQKLKSDTEIEKTENELARMRGSLTDDVQYWEQREMNVNIK